MTDQPAYTDADVLAASDALREWNDDWSITKTQSEFMLDAVVPAIVARAKAEALRELAERMSRANDNILAVREKHWQSVEQTRLTGKAEGIRLAKSYLDETVREIEAGR